MSAHPAEVVEVVARALCVSRQEEPDGTLWGGRYPDGISFLSLATLDATAALTALCGAFPGLSDLLAGRARVVPAGPTEEMHDAAFEALEFNGSDSRYKTGIEARTAVYLAMLAASPYAAAQPGTGGGDV